ncbi:MAG: S8 family serine peptidase, partial [Sulfolobales archaeon]
IAVWREFNITGDGVVIAILDTGVNVNHPLIGRKMFTVNASDPSYPGGWIEFDSKGRPVCSAPHDTDGHGSWVTSIAVGGDTQNILIGYAPGAVYIHALVLPTGSGTFAQVLAGLEWAADPYLCNGTKVSQILGRVFRPNIVSMSFGSEGNYSNYLLPAIKTLLDLGIIPIAAIGNGGIYTSSNPGNIWGVFGVGSIERDDSVSLFSSGEYVEWPDPPSTWPFKGVYPREYYKPDFVAPGVMIPGAYISEDLLAIGSGTSAAAPALAGIIALGLQAARIKKLNITPSSLYDLLVETAQKYGENATSKIRYGNGVVNALTFTAYILGYRLRNIEGFPSQAQYSVGSQGSYSIKGFQGRFTIYVDDQRYSGIGGSASFIVPPSDYGNHYIHAFSLEDRIYSYSKFKVIPTIRSSGPYVSGSELFLRLDGFPAVETIVIRFMSTTNPSIESNIIAIGFPNLRGRIDLYVRLPYIGTSQTISIIASDLIGLIGASISITIYPPPESGRTALITPYDRIQLLVSGPQSAAVGDTAVITIYPYLGGRVLVSNITVYIYYISPLGDLPQLLERIDKTSVGNLNIRINISNSGLYLLWINASSSQQLGSTVIRIEGSALYSIRAIPREELLTIENIYKNISMLSIEVANINYSISSLISSVTSLRDMYVELVAKYSNLYRNLESLARELNESKKNIASLQEISRSIVDEAVRIRNMFYITVVIALILTVVLGYTIYITRRRASL